MILQRETLEDMGELLRRGTWHQRRGQGFCDPSLFFCGLGSWVQVKAETSACISWIHNYLRLKLNKDLPLLNYIDKYNLSLINESRDPDHRLWNLTITIMY